MISHGYPSYNVPVINEAYKSMLEGEFSKRNIALRAEEKLSYFSRMKSTKIVSSGFTALQCALVGIGVSKGERVTIPNVTCPSVYHAIKSLGALPHIVDVDNIQPVLTTQSLLASGYSDYVIVPNMFGIKTNIDKDRLGSIKIIEDNAQCLGAASDWADMVTYSFSPTKLMTIGYGGAVATNSEYYLKRMSLFLDCEHELEVQTEGFENQELGFNIPFRIHANVADFQAAMLIEQLNRYDEIIKYRNKIALYYDKMFGHRKISTDIPFRYQIVLEEPRAYEVAEKLKSKGISVYPLASQLLHEVFDIEGNFENSYWWKEHVLSLPIHEALSNDNMEFIVNEVSKYI